MEPYNHTRFNLGMPWWMYRCVRDSGLGKSRIFAIRYAIRQWWLNTILGCEKL
jgi:hypothetical protein